MYTQKESHEHETTNNNHFENCETAEEAVTTDSEEYLAESLRYRNIHLSTSSNESTVTLTSETEVIQQDQCNINDLFNFNQIAIPIVGYEVMEERARFTVYKLRIENKLTNDSWFVFRRYTDFVRLCSKLKKYPQICEYLPKKKWIGNNFNPIFLEQRQNRLQILVNAILKESSLANLKYVQDFFCLTEPPTYFEIDQESKVVYDAMEESFNNMRKQLEEKDANIQELLESLQAKTLENNNLKQYIENNINNCPKCNNVNS